MGRQLCDDEDSFLGPYITVGPYINSCDGRWADNFVRASGEERFSRQQARMARLGIVPARWTLDPVRDKGERRSAMRNTIVNVRTLLVREGRRLIRRETRWRGAVSDQVEILGE